MSATREAESRAHALGAAPPVGSPTVRTAHRSQRIANGLLQGRGWRAARIGGDLVLLYLAVVAAAVGAPAAGLASGGKPEAWLLPLLTVALLGLRGGYRETLELRILDSVAHVAGAISLATMSLLALDSVLASSSGTSGLLVRAWVFGILYMAGGRVLLGLIRRGAQADRAIAKPTLIVGAGRVGAQVERRLDTHPELGLEPVGYLDADPLPADLLPGRRVPVLGAPADLPRLIGQTGAQHVIFAFLNGPDEALVPLVRHCHDQGIETSLVPRLYDSVNLRVRLEHMGGLPLYGLRLINPRGWQFALKHALGKVAAAALLVMVSPVMLAVAAAVKLTSPGPLLFRQRRIGRDGQEFDLLKFRSMTVSRRSGGAGTGGGRLRAVDDDTGPGGVEDPTQRLTPIGRFIRATSLDELPQLWNVLRGEMALVGPRPERPEFVELFGQSVRRYGERHRVKSGITGWAQVHGLRGRTSLADRVEWDNYYIENWSLWLDFKILLMTLAAPFRRPE